MLRRAISLFLMVLMLTPAMVCVMTFCPDVAHSAVTGDAPPCHGQGGMAEGMAKGNDMPHKSPLKPPVLSLDCLHNDLSTPPAAGDLPPPLLALFLFMAFLPLWAFSPPVLVRKILPARAPPLYDGVRASFHRLLVTQRILQ